MASGHNLVLLLLLVLQKISAEEKAETIESTPDKKFVAIWCPSLTSQKLGVVASKYFVVVPSEILPASVTDCVVQYTDISATGQKYAIHNKYSDASISFGVIKICPGLPSGYSAVPFGPTAFPAHAANYTSESGSAKIYYYRLSDGKFYNKTLDVLADASCANDAVGNAEASSGRTAGTTMGCLPFQDCPNTCIQYYDNARSMSIQPWVVINNQPVGPIISPHCTSSTADSTGTTFFLKLSGARTTLITLGTFDSTT